MQGITIILISLLSLALPYAIADTEHKVCGGSCRQSIDCARSSGDLSCRCSFFTCTLTASPCGGGCMTNEHCYTWSDGDPSCVCTWWFECDYEYVLKDPGYKPFLKIAAMAKARRERERA